MTIRSIGRALAAGCAALAVALLLAACGSAGDDGDGGASGATVAAATNASGAPGARGGRDRTELAACLKQQGVELPTPQGAPPQGDRRGMPGGPGGFGRDLSAAERRRMQAAFETCGGGRPLGGPGGRGAAGGSGAPSSAAIARFVACVRENGFDLPDANTSGRGPIFDAGTVDRDDPAFVKASRACQRHLARTG